VQQIKPFVLSSIILLSGIVACSGNEETAEAARAEKSASSDPIALAASDATTADTGIARWGYDIDAEAMKTTIRAYDSNDEIVVTIERTIESLDPENDTHIRSTVTMTGKVAGKQRVQMIEIPVPEDQGAPAGAVAVAINVEENSFPEGSLGKKILDRLAADSKGNEHVPLSSGQPTGLLETQVNELGAPLVKTCMKLLEACYQPTRDYESAAAGASSACSSVELIEKPVVGGVVAGAGGAILGSVVPAVGTAIGAVGGAAVGAVGGLAAGAWGCFRASREERLAARTLRACSREKNVSCP
jgi:hypothetical protein